MQDDPFLAIAEMLYLISSCLIFCSADLGLTCHWLHYTYYRRIGTWCHTGNFVATADIVYQVKPKRILLEEMEIVRKL